MQNTELHRFFEDYCQSEFSEKDRVVYSSGF